MSHLIESYSLAASSKISKPFILEKFYPLPFNRYITFQPQSKYPSKNYDLWDDVLNIIAPMLKERDINIVQIGGKDEKAYNHCYHTQSKTSLNQAAFIVKGGILHLGVDSVGVHYGGFFQKPIVALYSNNFINCVKSYWGDTNKQILLEPERNGGKPSFATQEIPKTINTIKSESIAKAVCQLLNLPFDYPYETLYVGENYINKILESVPKVVTNPQNINIDSLVIRMDYEFNEQVLAVQMQHVPVTIVTNKSINLELLKNYKPRIKQVFYVIEKDNSPEFVRNVQKLSIPISLFSYLPEEELNQFKLNYLDLALIQNKKIKTKEEIEEIKHISIEKLYYKSAKSTLNEGNIYISKAGWLANKPVNHVNEIQPIIDNEEWFKELEYFMVFRKKD